MNALFSNIHRLIYGWPEGHNFKHLKRQVIVDLVDHRDDYYDNLKVHLVKSKFSYEEAVTLIKEREEEA